MISNKKARKVILEMVEKIERDYQPEKVILFGSYAYGHPTLHSDIDLLIIKRTPQRPIDRRVEIRRLVYDPERTIAFSPLVYTPEEIERRLSLGDDFLEEILQKGEVLYER